MANETIFQHFIFREFILPFLLMFALIFAVLEKTKLLGDGQKQVNAIIAFVIGLIFVAAVYPKAVVNDLILFLTIAIVVMFVFLLLYGFVASDLKEGYKVESWMKWAWLIIISIATILAVIWATGADFFLIDIFFSQSWSGAFWVNFLFVVVIVVAIYFVLKGGKS